MKNLHNIQSLNSLGGGAYSSLTLEMRWVYG
nr:MAG TPA_asm: hypothetical protein [Caudoviricetes sp.]